MLRVGVKQKSRAARPCALYSGIVLTWAAKTERETVPLTPQIFHFENSGSNTTEFLTLRFPSIASRYVFDYREVPS